MALGVNRLTVGTKLYILLGRIAVPNNGACDWGLVKAGIIASCGECRKYYDPRSSYTNNDDGNCVYVPSKSKCFPLKYAQEQGMAVDDHCGKF